MTGDMSDALPMSVGNVNVITTSHRGHSTDEITDMCLEKVIYVGEDLPEPLRQQALAYKESLRTIIHFYINQAKLSERTTMAAEIQSANERGLN
tara:strand:+ start:511 stop:792 length:282 start_codon:yes stop_codon:yes gene_type:complete